MLGLDHAFWRDRRVFVTGHTGFKGGWLSLWLRHMGARVHGYALPANATPSFFDSCAVAEGLGHTLGDIRDVAAVERALVDAEAEVVFHLAAQSLVREGYRDPLGTLASNVMGTANLLQAARGAPSVRAVVVVASDKCYENREWLWPYRENEPLGGRDPYSASKACTEIVAAAWRDSFLAPRVHVATARAGNVLGGGDWSADRLLPDFLRAADAGQPLHIRSPSATRPWQHVLDLLAGYLRLAQRLHADGAAYAEAWNFGPEATDIRPVRWIVEYLCERVPGSAWVPEAAPQPHEANSLSLDSSKARARLGWRPRWALPEALDHTLEWHRAWRQGADMRETSLLQIRDYEAAAARE